MDFPWAAIAGQKVYHSLFRITIRLRAVEIAQSNRIQTTDDCLLGSNSRREGSGGPIREPDNLN